MKKSYFLRDTIEQQTAYGLKRLSKHTIKKTKTKKNTHFFPNASPAQEADGRRGVRASTASVLMLLV